MHRTDTSKYLLYIEPPANEKLETPVVDSLVTMMEYALSTAKKGASRYSNLNDEGTFLLDTGFKGCHFTECGERSTNHDYLLENGMITNSLAPFYLKYYRNSIPKSELWKLEQLKIYYKLDFVS